MKINLCNLSCTPVTFIYLHHLIQKRTFTRSHGWLHRIEAHTHTNTLTLPRCFYQGCGWDLWQTDCMLNCLIVLCGLINKLFFRLFLTWRWPVSWPKEVQLSGKFTDCCRRGNTQWRHAFSPATATHHTGAGLQRELPSRNWQIVRQASRQWRWRGVHGHMYGCSWLV